MLQRQEAIHGFLPTVTFFQPQSGPDLAQMATRRALGVPAAYRELLLPDQGARGSGQKAICY
jgi:hypothetical protein